jgi:hypothetical protein
MQKTLSNWNLIPIPDHPEIRTGTLLSFVRQSGLARSEIQ